MEDIQKGLFGEDFRPEKVKEKPKQKEKTERQLHIWDTSGLPGQRDFLGECDDSDDFVTGDE